MPPKKASLPIMPTLDEANAYVDNEIIPFAQRLLEGAAKATKFGAKLRRSNAKRWINVVGNDGSTIFARVDTRDFTLYTPCGTKPVCSLTDSHEWSRRMTAEGGLSQWDKSDKGVSSSAVITTADDK